MPDIPPPPERTDPLEPRYRLGAELGRGGMGRVVEAFDTQLSRTVALKEVLPKGGDGVEQRFEREVAITARLEHPSIVPLYDAGRMPDGRPFYVMRRVSGRPLDQLIHKARDLPERLALLPNVLAAIDAVGHAHKRGVVHRDLKPANILIGEHGETVVIDWGLAKVLGEDDAPAKPPSIPPRPVQSPIPASGTDGLATQPAGPLQTVAGAVFGTPGFMPPEQARGEGSTACGDVYALGATLYHLLAGRPPIAGTSATEAIASTLARKIAPIATAAPNAPADLHAIVEKALAFQPGDRYPDAERLAEDVRRFLTGQLVAAHDYSARERLARFAKKHRAPLSVAALALAAVAVLAWVGVHRILVERDLATTASQEADRQRDKAVGLNQQLADRADALVIAQARSRLAANPTEAMAIVKDLPPDSRQLGAARALAAAAAVRGVPWVLRADGVPRYLDLDRTATRLAEVTDDGVLHVWDLDARRALYERPYDARARPLWLADGRVLLIGTDARPPEALDLATSRIAPLPLQPIEMGTTDATGAHLAFVDGQHRAGVYDVATQQQLGLWPGHAVTAVRIAPDASWISLEDRAGFAICDGSGAIQYAAPGELAVLAVAPARLGALDASGAAIELVRDARGAWARRAIALPGGARALAVAYRGDRLEVATVDGVQSFRDGKPGGVVATRSGSWSVELAGETTAMQTSTGELAFWNDRASGTLEPPVSLSDVHLAARPDRSRLVVAGIGIVAVYELAQVLPRFVEKAGIFDAAFVDRDTLLLWPDGASGFSWRDLATGRTSPLDDRLLPLAQLLDRDPLTGRMLLFQEISPTAAELVVAKKGERAVDVAVRGDQTLRAVLAPDGILFAQEADARVMLYQRGAVRELAKVAGGVETVQLLDRRRFAALGKAGELVRGDLAGGALERVQIAMTADTFIAADRDGAVVVASGKQLAIWPAGGALHPFATLGRTARSLTSVPAGLVAVLDDHSIALVARDGTVHELMTAASEGFAIGGDGAWSAGPGDGGEIAIVELDSLAHWTLPRLFATVGLGQVVASPAGRNLMVSTYGGYALYALPDPASDLSAWVEDRTNATESVDGTLTWPWQRAP